MAENTREEVQWIDISLPADQVRNAYLMAMVCRVSVPKDLRAMAASLLDYLDDVLPVKEVPDERLD